MANIKSALKRAKKAEKNRLINAMHKSRLKTAIKKYKKLVAAEDKEAAKEYLTKVISLIDKSVNKGILHKNNAARKKSSLTRQLNQLNAQQQQ